MDFIRDELVDDRQAMSSPLETRQTVNLTIHPTTINFIEIALKFLTETYV